MSKLNYTNQHFLKDEEVRTMLVAFADITGDETCLEIGPGKGVVTREIAKDAKNVIAIERDISMKPYLDKLRAEFPNITVIYGNALSCKWPKFDKLVASIPFNITEPFFSKLFDTKFKYASLIVGRTFNNELADSRNEDPRTRLSLLASSYFDTESLLDISSKSFDPEPSTDANIIGIRPIKKRDQRDISKYLLRALWDQKTKDVRGALINGIENFAIDMFDCKTNVRAGAIVDSLGLESYVLDKRPANLDSSNMCSLYQIIKSQRLAKKIKKFARRGYNENFEEFENDDRYQKEQNGAYAEDSHLSLPFAHK